MLERSAGKVFRILFRVLETQIFLLINRHWLKNKLIKEFYKKYKNKIN